MVTRPNLRKSSEAERIHNAAVAESVSFGTTAGAMLLGVLMGAAEARAVGTAGTPGEHEAEAVSPPPAANAAHDAPQAQPEVGGDAEAASEPTAPLSLDFIDDFRPFAHSGAANGSRSMSDAAPGAHGDFPALSGELPASAFEPHGAEPPTTPEAAVQVAQAPLPAAAWHDAGALAQDIGATITSTLDASLASLAGAASNLTASVQQVASAIAPDMTQIAETISTATASMVQWALSAPAAAAGAVAGTVFEPNEPSPDSTAWHTQPPADALLDASGLLPVAPIPATVHLGFMGQPQADGHDIPDGAFSALGLHHF